MKRRKMLSLVFAVLLIIGLSGEALGGDGGGYSDPTIPQNLCPCETAEALPAPDAGKFLRGDFTVAYEKFDTSFTRLDVHVTLKWGNQTHLYSFWATPPPTWDLCNVSAEQLKGIFALSPCKVHDGTIPVDFGLSGVPLTAVPVITNLEILERDFGETEDLFDDMIRGELVVRVVPLPEEEPQ